MSERRVVVAGGGLAGMAAALACADGGARVTLLEGSNRLGGATFSFRRNGLTVDNGQHVFLRCCTAYLGFLDRIRARGLTVVQPRLSIPVLVDGGRVGWIRRGSLPVPLHLVRAVAAYPFLTWGQKARLARTTMAMRRLDSTDPGLDRRTFGDWLSQHGESREAIESLWDLIATPTLNLPASQASLALAAKVFVTGLLTDRGAADIGYARVPLSRLHAETGGLALAGAGVDVHTRSAVRAIERFGGGVVVRTDDGSIEADAAVAAVPHDRVAGILPPGALSAPERLADLGASPIVNVHVVYDRRVTNLPFLAGLRSPVQWAFDRTGPSGLDRGQYLAISISSADREIGERTESLRRRFLPALERLLPRARAATVTSFFVTREHAATFCQAPGTMALRPGPRTGVPGVFLAGAWTDTGWPATMEGAVRSGLAAAREALLGTNVAPPVPEEVAV
jgi:squalene-associated FAD-dependent desaturase